MLSHLQHHMLGIRHQSPSILSSWEYHHFQKLLKTFYLLPMLLNCRFFLWQSYCKIRKSLNTTKGSGMAHIWRKARHSHPTESSSVRRHCKSLVSHAVWQMVALCICWSWQELTLSLFGENVLPSFRCEPWLILSLCWYFLWPCITDQTLPVTSSINRCKQMTPRIMLQF